MDLGVDLSRFAETCARAALVRAEAQQLRDESALKRAETAAVRSIVRAGTRTGSQHRTILAQLRNELNGLREAMQTRAPIEQAKGMIMATEHCDAEEAFAILVKMSQRQHIKLRDLADLMTQSAARTLRSVERA